MTRTTSARRLIAVAGVLGLSASLLAACSSDGDATGSGATGEPAETLTLTSGYAEGDPTADWLDETVAAFEAESGIEVEILTVPWDDLTNEVETTTLAGEQSDLYTLNFTDLVKPFLDEGAIVDTTQYLDDWGITPLLQEGATESWAYDGMTGGFPWAAFYWPVWWNTEILDAAGVAGVPQTTDELIAANEKIRAAGYETLAIDGADWGGSGFTWMTSQTYVPADEAATLMSEGGWASSENAIRSFDLLAELRDEGVFVDNAEGYTNAEVQTQFLEGKVAAAHMGSWAYAAAVEAGMDLDTIQLGGYPIPADGAYDKPLALRGGGNGWLLASSAAEDPARLAAVKAFITFLYQPEQLQSWVGTYSQFSPATPEAIGEAEPDNALNKYSATELLDEVDFVQLHDLLVKPGVDILPEVSWFLGTEGATGKEFAERLDALYQG